MFYKKAIIGQLVLNNSYLYNQKEIICCNKLSKAFKNNNDISNFYSEII